MPKEIERKFLVESSDWKYKASRSVLITQGYICREQNRSVRIRITDDKAYLTVKIGNDPLSRIEFEFGINEADARELLDCLDQGKLIVKRRSFVNVAEDLKWEIDEFQGSLEGLVIAEIELSDPDQRFEIAHWLGKEVTIDTRFMNENLCGLSVEGLRTLLSDAADR